MTALYDQSSAGAAIATVPQTDSIDNLLANLAEDNANSLPSGDDETRFVPAVENNHHNMVANNLLEYEVPIEPELLVEAKENDVRADILEQIDLNNITNNVSNEEHMEVESIASSQVAIAEDIPNGEDSQATKVDIDAEMVSEDELPAPSQEKVDDAEEVSDEELPGPKLPELPADTEVVSEDELPSSNKSKRKVDEGYDPGSPTESSEAPEKKNKGDDTEDVDGAEKKKEKEEKEKEKKALPDLDKFWKAVNDDPADFTGWTYLLQYVDQENDVEAARQAYDAFLAHYPYCYGYWRKYADYEKRKGNKGKCEEVFERGLKAIPLSVDLWIHYLTHVKQNNPDDDEPIRVQFERALTNCGLEFRSDKLWEAYIKWETEAKRMFNVVAIYDRLLATPTQGYNGHFDSFQEIVNNNSILTLVSLDEFKQLRAEVRESEAKDPAAAETEDPSIAPGEDEPDDHVRNEEETTAIKDKILAVRRKIHKTTVTAVTARWTFEEGIKRPYFHVKPLERCQLKNWKEYLDFEIEQGDRKRVLVLFERCLIACALYEEFWLKLIRYLESQGDAELIEKTRDVYERACTVHHTDKPSLQMMWAAFEEFNDSATKAADILANLDKASPNLLQVAYKRINLERRRNDLERCEQLYEHYITNAKSKSLAGSLAIKYARFCHKIKKDLDGGYTILKAALEKDPANTRVVLQMIDLALQRDKVDENEIVDLIDSFMARDNIELDQKVLFAQRKVEFLEDFGSTAKALQDAQRILQSTLTKANDAKKKSELSPIKKSTKDTQQAQSSSSNYGSYGNYGSGNSSSYYSASQYSSQPYNDGYGYNQQWQQYGSGFSGYGQWSGYGSSGYY